MGTSREEFTGCDAAGLSASPYKMENMGDGENGNPSWLVNLLRVRKLGGKCTIQTVKSRKAAVTAASAGNKSGHLQMEFSISINVTQRTKDLSDATLQHIHFQ